MPASKRTPTSSSASNHQRRRHVTATATTKAKAEAAEKARLESVENGLKVMVQLSHLNDQWLTRQERVYNGESDPIIDTVDTLALSNQQATEIVDQLERLPHVSRAMWEKQRTLELECWQRHVAVRENVKPGSTTDVKTILFLSWVAYLRHSLLFQQMTDALSREDLLPDENGDFEEWPSCLASTATDFDYVVQINSRMDIKAGRGPIGRYTVAQVMLAIVSLRDALDAYGWVPSASRYFKALLWRYALTLAYPEKYATDPGEYEATGPANASPFLAPALVTNEYLNIGERLFFHMIWRMRALYGFVEPQWFDQPISPSEAHIDWAEWRINHGIPGLLKGITSMLTHRMIGETVDETLSNNLMDYFVMPGECEQLQFDFPDESDKSATNTIFRLRMEFHTKAQFLHKDKLKDTLDMYISRVKLAATRLLHARQQIAQKRRAEAQGERVVPEESGPPRLSIFEEALLVHQEMHERVILLLIQIAFDTQATINRQGKPFQRHSYLDNQARPAPEDRPPLGPQATLLMSNVLGNYPLFICIWSTYMVIDKTGKVCWVTPHMIDAFAVWMSLAVKDEQLKAPGIMEHWGGMLKNLPSLSF